MKFLSVCSGIEAASVAWAPLGWKAVGFSEIEPFPSAVLKHHYPGVINYGDMTKLPELIRSKQVDLPEILCGGTPCQAFSVAGLRRSLEDERGNLSLVFCEIANAIDDERVSAGLRPGIVFWENVPGVLSTKDNAFGCFVAGLAGEDVPIEPPGGKWTDAGAVLGPKRAVAWRVLDAQYFGLAQRRKRVFVVASARDGFDPLAVLFEREGVRRDSAPSREAGKVAPTIPSRSTAGGGLGTAFDCDGGVVQPCVRCRDFFAKYRCNAPDECDCPRCQGMCGCYANKLSTYCIKGAAIGRKPEAGPQHGEVLEEACYTLNCVDQHAVAVMSSGQANAEIGTDGGALTLTCLHEAPNVAHSLRGEGFDASEDGTGRGTPLVPVHREVAPALTSNYGKQPDSSDTNAGPMLVPVAMVNMQGSKGNAVVQEDGPSFTLNAMHGHDVHAIAVPVTFRADAMREGTAKTPSPDAEGRVRLRDPGMGMYEDIAPTLDCGAAHGVAHAFDARQSDVIQYGDKTGPLDTDGHSVGVLASVAPVTHTLHGTDGTQLAVAVAVGTDCFNGAVTGDVAATMGTPGSSINASGPTVMVPAAIDTYNQTEQDTAHTIRSGAGMEGVPATYTAMQVRRLTPVECERLQGFPDGYTAIPWRNKPASECPDGPRYKALGNSWAVPVVRWIGQRIDHAAASET